MKLVFFLLLTGLAHAASFSVEVSGHGKPVILIPGLGCGGEVWRETVAHLNAAGYETYAVTLAGFAGTKPISSDHLLATVRDDLAAYIRQKKLDHPVVIGHSLGGFEALWLAAEEPELVGKVLSVDGLPFLTAIMTDVTPEGAANAAAAIKKRMLEGTEEERRKSQQETIESMVTSAANRGREMKVAMTSDRNTVAQAMAEMTVTDIRPELPKIKAPVMVLGSWIAYKEYGATHESAVPLYTKQFEKLPGVKIVLSDTARHFIQLDDPEWFYSQVDLFLGNK